MSNFRLFVLFIAVSMTVSVPICATKKKAGESSPETVFIGDDSLGGTSTGGMFFPLSFGATGGDGEGNFDSDQEKAQEILGCCTTAGALTCCFYGPKTGAILCCLGCLPFFCWLGHNAARECGRNYEWITEPHEEMS